MNELMIEIISGVGVLASGFFYTKFQTAQNQNGGVIARLDKMDILLEKIFDKLNK